MKKTFSLLIALAAAASMCTAAFASDEPPETPLRMNRLTQQATVASTQNNDSVTVGAGELFLVDTSDKVVVSGLYDTLAPDTEYRFRIYHNNGAEIRGTSAEILNHANVAELNGAMVGGGTVRLRTVRSSSGIQSAHIKSTGRNEYEKYQLILTTRGSFGTKTSEVEYSLTVTGSKSTTHAFNESSHIFEVGYQSIGDNQTDVGEGGYITISNDYPVITKEQFEAIAKSANYKSVNIEGEDGGWLYTGRVSGMGDSNFSYTYDVIPELIDKFPDQEYKFLNFQAGVNMGSTGDMRIDVSDLNDGFGDYYLYLYRNGKLTSIDHTYDSGSREVVFRTNYLGAFVITNQKITDTSVPNFTDNDDQDMDDTGGAGSGNPSTGASRSMRTAVSLGLASIAVAGTMLLARKKKHPDK